MRIDTGGVLIYRGRLTCPGDGSDIAEQGLWIDARTIPSGYRRRRVRGAALRRHRAAVLRRKADQPVRANARGRRPRHLSTFTGFDPDGLRAGRPPYSAARAHRAVTDQRSSFRLFAHAGRVSDFGAGGQFGPSQPSASRLFVAPDQEIGATHPDSRWGNPGGAR
jgi:hypothetical protein